MSVSGINMTLKGVDTHSAIMTYTRQKYCDLVIIGEG